MKKRKSRVDLKMKKQRISSIGSDKNKAARYIVIGFIVAVIFGTVLGTSKYLSLNASDWATNQKALNLEYVNLGLMSDQEYDEKAAQIDLAAAWMVALYLPLSSFARIGVSIGLILVMIGFVGIGINDSIDERTRRIALVFAAVVLFVLMFTIFFTNLTIEIS